MQQRDFTTTSILECSSGHTFVFDGAFLYLQLHSPLPSMYSIFFHPPYMTLPPPLTLNGVAVYGRPSPAPPRPNPADDIPRQWASKNGRAWHNNKKVRPAFLNGLAGSRQQQARLA